MYVINLAQKKLPPSIGAKAANLRRLLDKGYEVPQTWVITWEAYQRYQQNDHRLVEDLRRELEAALPAGTAYAVRSSASLEDNLEYSFAGQFKTVLDVRGTDQILQAAWSIWATTQKPTVQQYLGHLPCKNGLEMAVIVQAMVRPHISGVVFSRNPMTGADEIVVEAVIGSGAQLVQDGVTPGRWVYKWGAWLMQPEDESIPLEVIQQVVTRAAQISKTFGQALDLEWVYDGESIYWVQMREITTLAELNIYSNRISREMIPGVIKPLIWSVNIPLVNNVWIQLLTEMIGKNDLQPHHLAKSFYYRAYFNMGTLGRIFTLIGMPSESLEMMMGIVPKEVDHPAFKPSMKTMRLMPRLAKMAYDKWYFERAIRGQMPGLEAQIAQFDRERICEMSELELLAEIDQLYALCQRLVYFNIVVPLLMAMYNRMVYQQLRRMEVDFANFDLMDGVSELEQYSPDVHLSRLYQEFCALEPAQQETVRNMAYLDFKRMEVMGSFQQNVEDFIERFGHLSDSGNDFSAVPWREQPDQILKMICTYEPKPPASNGRIRIDDLSLRGFKRGVFGLFYRRARRFRLLREQISSRYTYAYGLFREIFLALGRHFVHRGLIDQAEDVFYFDLDQARRLAASGDDPPPELRALVERHKAEIERVKDLSLPAIIYGDQPPPVQLSSRAALSGTPTSRGYYSGPVKVVRGIEDFSKMKEGDVLVVPFSDVGWTPLFARAGAVVAESGGLLSHSSIVAREYKIPAVVSVANACTLPDRATVTVDGFKGEIILHSDHE